MTTESVRNILNVKKQHFNYFYTFEFFYHYICLPASCLLHDVNLCKYIHPTVIFSILNAIFSTRAHWGLRNHPDYTDLWISQIRRANLREVGAHSNLSIVIFSADEKKRSSQYIFSCIYLLFQVS